MSETKLRRGWGALAAKILLALAVVLGTAGWVGFKMYEPFLVFRSGWKAVPAAEAPVVAELLDERWAAAAEEARAALEKLRPEMGGPAVSAAVAIDGKLVWRGAVGWADLDALRPVAFGDRFRIGSTSKAVTSVGMGVAMQRYGVDLDAPIQTYVHSFPEKPQQVTLRQIMSHTAGFREYGACLCIPVSEYHSRHPYTSVTDALRVFAHSPLLFEPGTRHQYSSFGYNIAGAAIETLSGEFFGDYMEEAVFAPLGMTSTDVEPHAGRKIASYATPYDVYMGYYKPAYRIDVSNRWPSGGILSTPSDMAILGSAMLDDRLLTEETRRTLTTAQPGAVVAGDQGYALGWRTGDLDFGEGRKIRAWHHGGQANGASSAFWALPGRRMAVSVMTNKTESSGMAQGPGVWGVGVAITEAFLEHGAE